MLTDDTGVKNNVIRISGYKEVPACGRQGYQDIRSKQETSSALPEILVPRYPAP